MIAVCTLFEGDYHYGLGALVNSLCRLGFAGVIWAGYRGMLPPWASATKDYEDIRELRIQEDVLVRFVKIETQDHFTNHKPQFMLRIMSLDPNAEAVLYFDPDITIKSHWEYFEEWLTCGVALCEDVNSPLSENHPRRCAWRRFYNAHGIRLRFTTETYVNAGFIGLRRSHSSFLTTWARMQELMASQIGGLQCSSLGDESDVRGPEFCFSKSDQDALNACIEAVDVPLSVLGKEGMDFVPGGFTMSHAIGRDKPWRKKFLSSALRGTPPTLADKSFLANTQSPIRLYSKLSLELRRKSLVAGSAIGRLIRRS